MKWAGIALVLAVSSLLASAGQCQDRCNDQYNIGLNMAEQYLQEKWYTASERPESVARLGCPQWTYIFDFVAEDRLMSANQVCYSENRRCHEPCTTEECGENCDDVLTQQCCYNATLLFLVEAKTNCLSQCGSETPTPTPTPTPSPTPPPSPTPASTVCMQQCDREYGAVIAHQSDDLASKSFSPGSLGNCGNDASTGSACTHGYGDCLLNCPESDDACRSACNGAMQQCCYQASVSMLTQAKEDCKRRCAALDVPVSAVDYAWPGGYQVSITSHGDVEVDAYNSSTMRYYPTTVILPGTRVITNEGSATITFTKPGGAEAPITLKLYPGTMFVITAYGEYEIVCEGVQGGLGFSSDHGTIRGTINGGGCFMCGAEGREAVFSGAGGARFDVAPPVNRGKVEVSETRGAHTPDFVLEVSLPGGFFVVNSTAAEGTANYSIEPQNGGVTVNVDEGAVRVSDRSTLEGRVLQSGETEFLRVSDLAPTPTPGPTGTPHTTATPAYTSTPSVECTKSSDCPGALFCKDGRCVEPTQCFGFVLLLAGGTLAAGALYARRGG